jgi:hypothetical protein
VRAGRDGDVAVAVPTLCRARAQGDPRIPVMGQAAAPARGVGKSGGPAQDVQKGPGNVAGRHHGQVGVLAMASVRSQSGLQTRRTACAKPQ